MGTILGAVGEIIEKSTVNCKKTLSQVLNSLLRTEHRVRWLERGMTSQKLPIGARVYEV
jgi:hypothetical protein